MNEHSIQHICHSADIFGVLKMGNVGQNKWIKITLVVEPLAQTVSNTFLGVLEDG
jgi:hypothetical protein